MVRRFILFGFLLAVAIHVCGQNVTTKFRVSGKVVNAVNGHPLAGADVWLGNAEDLEATQQKLLTGDDGMFAFTVSQPGKYLLSGQDIGFRRQGFEQHGGYVSAIVVGNGLITESLVFRLRPDARVMGVVEDDDHEPVQNAIVYLFRTDANFGLRQTYLSAQTTTDDRGRYRLAHLEPGCYSLVVSAAPWFSGLLQQAEAQGNAARTEKREFDVAFPMTFYPGVTDMASASQIALNEGEDFTADFTLSPVPALRVRLNHFNADPQKPKNATLQQRVFGTTINHTWLRETQVEDSLEMRGVPPGRYVLQIESFDAGRSTRSAPITLTADTEFDPDSAPAVAPIHGVVRTRGGMSLNEQAFVRLWNSRTDEVMDSRIGDKGEIYFDTDFLTPGTYLVYAMNGLNATASSLKATGAQVAGLTVQNTGGKPVELEIEMSSRLSKINGTVRRDGKPMAGAMILLVPEDAELNLPKFRRDQSDSDGTYTLRDVLPGRYWMMAIEDGWELEWANLALLKNRLEHAQKIDVEPNRTYQTVVDVE